jgi:hypothetical protein
MRNEDGVETCGQSRIDVRFWAIAHHPGPLARQPVLADYLFIGRYTFLWNNLHLLKEILQS